MLNLPASQDIEPSMPCVYKLNMIVNKIAGDYVVFFDDIRVLGLSVKNCWQCGRKLSSNIQFLGIQDATRKKRSPSLTPGDLGWIYSKIVKGNDLSFGHSGQVEKKIA